MGLEKFVGGFLYFIKKSRRFLYSNYFLKGSSFYLYCVSIKKFNSMFEGKNGGIVIVVFKRVFILFKWEGWMLENWCSVCWKKSFFWLLCFMWYNFGVLGFRTLGWRL